MKQKEKDLINSTEGWARRLMITLLMFMFVGVNLQAQEKISISGVVKSSTEPLIGVYVVEKGTNNGTTTDLDGFFKLSVQDGASVVVSYIGYTTQTIEVGVQREFSIELLEEDNFLEEVVAIGYGVQKKKLNTGATLQVKGDALEKMNTTSAVQALQGKTPGVNISSTSGQPGKAMKVTIRGLGTVNDASPLYIVDGIQTGDISYLNSSDIESIDVLKDAASAAIYGSQSANGVVLITTKSGAKGRAQVSFDAYYGVQRASRKIRMLNTDEYKMIMDEQALNENKPAFNWDSYDLGNVDTDWINKMLVNDAVTQDYVLGIQGGSEKSIYSLSLSYTGQEGIVGGGDVSKYERYGFRTNTEHKLYDDFLTVGQHLTFTFSKNRGVSDGNQYGNSLRNAFGMSPFVPVYDEDGEYWDNSNSKWNNTEGNPYGMMMLNNINRNQTQKLIGDIYAELNFTKDLKFRTTLGFDYHSDDSRSYTPAFKFSVSHTANQIDKVVQSMGKGYALSIDNILSYSKGFDEHQFDAMIGQSARKYTGQSIWGNNTDLRTPGLIYAWLNNAENTAVTKSMYGGSPSVDQALSSYFGRLSYNYKSTYMFNATFRADGSSKFKKGNRWGYFPSFSAGWTVTNEKFMESTNSWLDYLKARVSWGQVGNQNIDDFGYLSLISSGAIYNFGTTEGEDGNKIGYYPSSLPNENIKWETSEQLNFGLDARLFGRLDVNFDWYHKTTKDWLVTIPVLATSGLRNKIINGGDVKNQGVELGLNWNDNIGDFSYSLGANIAYNKNEVGNIPTEDGIIHGQSNMLYANSTEFYRAQNGHPIGYFWGYKTNGIFQNEEEIAAWQAAGNGVLQSDVKPGDVRYIDVNGYDADGNVVAGADGKIDDADKVDIGNPNPDFTYGFNISLGYKNFDFAVNSYGVSGNKIVQSYRDQTGAKNNYTTAVLGRWHGEGTSNSMPRVTESNINRQFSELYLQDGAFWRISNITLGYDFTKLINCKFISQLRIYGQLQNPITFTNYDGMDPEVGWGDEDFGSGIDIGMYPRAKAYLMGINIKF